jgi:hypothetical protein
LDFEDLRKLLCADKYSGCPPPTNCQCPYPPEYQQDFLCMVGIRLLHAYPLAFGSRYERKNSSQVECQEYQASPLSGTLREKALRGKWNSVHRVRI